MPFRTVKVLSLSMPTKMNRNEFFCMISFVSIKELLECIPQPNASRLQASNLFS